MVRDSVDLLRFTPWQTPLAFSFGYSDEAR